MKLKINKKLLLKIVFNKMDFKDAATCEKVIIMQPRWLWKKLFKLKNVVIRIDLNKGDKNGN